MAASRFPPPFGWAWGQAHFCRSRDAPLSLGLGEPDLIGYGVIFYFLGGAVPGLHLPDDPGQGLIGRRGADLSNMEPDAAIVINCPGAGNFLSLPHQLRKR